MKTILGWTATVGGSLAVWACIIFYGWEHRGAITNGLANWHDSQIQYNLEQQKAEIERTLPKRLGSIEVRTGVHIEGRTLVLKTKLDLDKERFRADFADAVRTALVAALCKDWLTTNALKTGISYRYEYVDRTGQPMPSVLMTADDCGLMLDEWAKR